MAAKEKSGATDSVVEEARKRFKRAEDFYGPARQLAIADTQFAMGDSDNGWQWPNDMLALRTSARKVALTVNMTAQHCNQIINQIRQNKPSAKVSPVDDKADKKTAEILAGLLRNIQTASNADDAHDVGAEHAIYGGEGYWRVYTEYESPRSFDQVICIGPCPNPNLLFVDPDFEELDKSDAQWGFVFEDLSKEQFKREYPDIDPASWQGGPAMNGWIHADTYRRAEYFYCEFVKDTALLLQDGRAVLKSELPVEAKYTAPKGDMPGTISGGPNGAVIMVTKERETERKVWHWCKLVGGHDKPLDEQIWPGEYLPIISVVGKELNVNGQVVRKGIVRDLKDPARMVNYTYSESIQTVALQNKIPYLAAAEALEGYEEIWQAANADNRAYLPYNAFMDGPEGENTVAVPAPQRQQPAVMPTAMVNLLHLSTEQMRAASGQQNANFGIRSEAASGIGIERLKVQGEVATFHFPDNLRRALQYEAKVIIDLIQKIYDTKRVVRVLGLDGKEEHATLDPEAQQPYAEVGGGVDEEQIQKIFNPLLGRYDVVINTGPTYQTQRQEAFATLTELAVKDPRTMAIAGDIVMRAGDFPMSEQLAERYAKALPPELKDQKPGQQPEGPDPAMVQQMEMAIQGMTQHIEQLEQDNLKMQQELANKDGELTVKDNEVFVSDKEADAKMVEARAAETEAEAKLIEARADFIRAEAEAQGPPEVEAQDDDGVAAALDALAQQVASLTQMQQPPQVQQPPVMLSIGQKTTQKTIAIRGPSGQIYEGTVTEEVPDVPVSEQ